VTAEKPDRATVVTIQERRLSRDDNRAPRSPADREFPLTAPVDDFRFETAAPEPFGQRERIRDPVGPGHCPFLDVATDNSVIPSRAEIENRFVHFLSFL